ncbi:MAG: DUF3775 domain-containing protein [Alphaproteobacteria bacterium]|nr:DUF3775 domain-containing protein [Alphaproteobacteria bacterium]
MPKGPQLTIAPEKVAYIILLAKAFDAKDVLTDPGDSSDGADDRMIRVLEEHSDDAVAQILADYIDELSVDEQVDLVALAWLGRPGNDVSDWPTLHAQARREHRERTSTYLLGLPLLGDELAEGLSALGYQPEELEADLP